jgi:hypothetical protein
MAAHNQPPPAYPAQQPQQQRASSSNKGWYIATAVVAVVVIAVVSIIVVTSGTDTADCGDRTADDEGFSECMRSVAGAVVENNECNTGAVSPLGGEPISTPGATTATCEIDGTHSVMYMHFGSSEATDGSSLSGEETAKQNMESLVQQLEGYSGDPKTGSWDGNGMAGDYTAFDIGGGSGMLAFTVDGSPVTGVLFGLETSGGSIDDLVGYFEDHVKPGADGGA